MGVHFIVWDLPVPRFREIKERFPLIRNIPSEVFFMGDEFAYWHAGSANRRSYGVEIRNCGQLRVNSANKLFWCRGKYRYRGRPPIQIGGGLWEPYTKSQMMGTLWLHRLMAAVHDIKPHLFLGHTQISSTRVDPGLHFPLEEMRFYTLAKPYIPLDEVPFISKWGPSIVLDNGTLEDEMELHGMLSRDHNDGELLPVERDHGEVWGAWEQIAPSEVMNIKDRLYSFGYYVGRPGKSVTPELVESVKLFQARWKTRGRNRRWISQFKATGIYDKNVANLLDLYEGHLRRLRMDHLSIAKV